MTEAVDILINPVHRDRPVVLGIWKKERVDPDSGAKHVIYERPSSSFMITDVLGWFIPINFISLIGEYIGLTRTVEQMVLKDPRATVHTEAVISIPDFCCPACGSQTEIRLLAGGTVDKSNPNLPMLLFGNWHKTILSKVDSFRMLNDLQVKADKFQIELDRLRPMERENEAMRENILGSQRVIDIQETSLVELREQTDRLEAERVQIMTVLKARGIPLRDVVKGKAAAEAVAIAKESVATQDKVIETLEKNAAMKKRLGDEKSLMEIEKIKRERLGGDTKRRKKDHGTTY